MKVRNQVMPQTAVGGGVNGIPMPSSKSNPQLAKRTAGLLLSETKATLPENVQNHIQQRTVDSAERARRLQSEMANVYGKKTLE